MQCYFTIPSTNISSVFTYNWQLIPFEQIDEQPEQKKNIRIPYQQQMNNKITDKINVIDADIARNNH